MTSNDRVTKPDAAAFGDVHPLRKAFRVTVAAFLLPFRKAVLLGAL